MVKAKNKNPNDSASDELILAGDSRWEIAGRAARSSALSRATQLRDILLFIVRQDILKPDESVHESEIAHRVLGRRSDFNPLDDNIVRVQMAHLRKKLDLYFSTEGKDEEVVITVSLGSYKPVFSNRAKASSAQHQASEAETLPREPAAGTEEGAVLAHGSMSKEAKAETTLTAGGNRRMAAALVAACLIAIALGAACVGLWRQNRDQQQTLDTIGRTLSPWKFQPALASLWSGFFDTNRETDVVISDDSFLLVEEIEKRSTGFYGYLNRSYIGGVQNSGLSPESRFLLGMIASKSLGNTSEFKLAQRILALDPLGKKTHMYSARQYMPALVKQDNAILIGGRISNPWAEMFEDRLNFIEETRFEGYGVTVVNNRAPAAGEQPSYTSTDAVGYCVVAYMPNPSHDGSVLLLEGTSSEATEAAGDFLLSEDQFAAFRNRLHAAKLPYFEVLLKTSQVRGTPLTATIEAYRAYPNLH